MAEPQVGLAAAEQQLVVALAALGALCLTAAIMLARMLNAGTRRLALSAATALVLALVHRRFTDLPDRLPGAPSHSSPAPPPKREPRHELFTHEQLAPFSGRSPRLLLAILGSVYDVSTGKQYYAPGGAYEHFTGRDGSRAFVTGDFTSTESADLTDDLSTFTEDAQFAGVLHWHDFYEQHDTYTREGVLAGGAFYGADGRPTAALEAARERGAAHRRAEAAKGRQSVPTEPPPPHCHSRAERGMRSVWCDGLSGSAKSAPLVPRELREVGVAPRCACVAADVAATDPTRFAPYECADAASSVCTFEVRDERR